MHKVFVVQQLACYATLTEVRAAVKERFGLDVSRQQVAYYDPTTAAGGDPAKQWQDLHEETREAYREGTQDVAIAQRRWRLERLERGARKLGDAKNYLGEARLLEQAAKETGGKYTNEQKHEHTGKNGGPVQTVNANIDVSDFEETDDPEQLMRLFNDTFGGQSA